MISRCRGRFCSFVLKISSDGYGLGESGKEPASTNIQRRKICTPKEAMESVIARDVGTSFIVRFEGLLVASSVTSSPYCDLFSDFY